MKTTVTEEKTDRTNGHGNGRLFVKRELVRPDPDQPRKMFDLAKLRELAESIKEQGIIQDLLVCYQPGVRITAPDLVEKSWQAIEEGTGRVVFAGAEREVRGFAEGKKEAWYRIVDGERRWRAADLAGLKEVPVAVRRIEEKNKLALQVVANQQREALTALEEAAAYQKEIDSKRHTAESLYKALGISRGTLFSRLVLNRLHPPVRAALEAGKISVSVAGLIAMVPQKQEQEKLVKHLTDEESWQYPWSFREVQEHIEEEYCKQLKGAPFDVKKIYGGLFKDDGGTAMLSQVGTCEKCPWRSGNMEGVECKNPNVCTRPKCYEAKAANEWSAQSLKAQATGQKVLDESSWRKQQNNYVDLEKEEYIAGKNRTWKAAMGGQAKTVTKVLAQTADGVKEVVLRVDAEKAAKANGVKLTSNGTDWNGRWRKEREEKGRRRKQNEKVVKQAATAIVLKASRPVKDINAAFLKDLCELAIRRTGAGTRLIQQRPQAQKAKGKDEEEKAIDYARNVMFSAEDNLVGLLVECLIRPETDWEGSVCAAFKEDCALFGVDLKKVERELAGTAEEKKPQPSAKKSKTQKGGASLNPNDDDE